jgi:hypothetical protein
MTAAVRRRSDQVCVVPAHRPQWVVTQRQHNRSTFNGGKWTPSVYSSVRCPECPRTWRTRAAYVADLPDAEAIR